MALIHCRRRIWLRLQKWLIVASVALLISWWYQSWILHGFEYLSSPVYRECVARRKEIHGLTEDHSQELFVTLGNHGRIGNKMFQYASLLGIAKSNGLTPYLSQGHFLTYDFEITNLRSEPADCQITVQDIKPLTYTESLNHLPKANITLDGYFQSWKYFRGMEKEIKQEFAFKPNTAQMIRLRFENYVGRYVKAGFEVISIHVRRGDYASDGAKRLGFKPAPASYFINAIRYMIKRHPYSVFLIVSDNIDWCRQNILPNLVLLKYRKPEINDMDSYTRQIFMVDRDGKDNDDKGVEFVDATKAQVEKMLAYAKDRLLNNDDKQIGENNVVNLGSPPIVLTPRDSSIVDLGLLTLANHSIMSVGTFGWWGAWLAGGDVTYYKDFLEEGHYVYYQWTQGDFFPLKWVAISDAMSLFPFSLQNLVLVFVCNVFCNVVFTK